MHCYFLPEGSLIAARNIYYNSWRRFSNLYYSVNVNKSYPCFFNTGREGHTAAISDLSVEPGGTLIATASIDGKSKLISTATGKVIIAVIGDFFCLSSTRCWLIWRLIKFIF